MTGFSVAVEVTKPAAPLVSDGMACPAAESHLSFDTAVALAILKALETYRMAVVVWSVTLKSVDVLVSTVLCGTKQFLYVSPATIPIWSEPVVFPCYLVMISLDGCVYVEVPGKSTNCAPAEISVVAADIADADAAVVQIFVDSADSAVYDAAGSQNSVAAADIADDGASVVQLSVVAADGVVDDDDAFQNFVPVADIVLFDAAEIERMDQLVRLVNSLQIEFVESHLDPGTDSFPLASAVGNSVAGRVNH